MLFKWSKTNQFGPRKLMLPLVRLDDNSIGPVAMYMYLCMCSFYPAPPSGLAFSSGLGFFRYTKVNSLSF